MGQPRAGVLHRPAEERLRGRRGAARPGHEGGLRRRPPTPAAASAAAAGPRPSCSPTRYGRFEFRAKLPTGQGSWPALWLLPQGDPYGGWAASGEIDVMEARGSHPGDVQGTIHYGGSRPRNVWSGQVYHLPGGGTVADWHVYALDWDAGPARLVGRRRDLRHPGLLVEPDQRPRPAERLAGPVRPAVLRRDEPGRRRPVRRRPGRLHGGSRRRCWSTTSGCTTATAAPGRCSRRGPAS